MGKRIICLSINSAFSPATLVHAFWRLPRDSRILDWKIVEDQLQIQVEAVEFSETPEGERLPGLSPLIYYYDIRALEDVWPPFVASHLQFFEYKTPESYHPKFEFEPQTSTAMDCICDFAYTGRTMHIPGCPFR